MLGPADCTTLLSGAPGFDDTDQNAYAFTMSAGLQANRLGLAVVFAQSLNNTNPNLTAISMSGVPMTIIDTVVVSSFQRTYLCRCLGAAPSGTTLSLTFSPSAGTINFVHAHAVEWANVKTTGSNGTDALLQVTAATDIASTTTPSFTLGAPPAANNAVFGVFRNLGGGFTYTPGTDFTIKGPSVLALHSLTSQAGQAGTVGDTIDAMFGAAAASTWWGLEIAEADAGGGGTPPTSLPSRSVRVFGRR